MLEAQRIANLEVLILGHQRRINDMAQGMVDFRRELDNLKSTLGAKLGDMQGAIDRAVQAQADGDDASFESAANELKSLNDQLTGIASQPTPQGPSGPPQQPAPSQPPVVSPSTPPTDPAATSQNAQNLPEGAPSTLAGVPSGPGPDTSGDQSSDPAAGPPTETTPSSGSAT